MQYAATADGRHVEVVATGPADAPVLLFHSGTPMTALQPRFLSDAVGRRGWRLVTFSRPGYATSSRTPGRSVADVVTDATAVLDALGVERAFVGGVSGGGPHALACVALLPERFPAAVVMSGVAPYDADGLDFLGGMGQDNIDEMTAALDGEVALRGYLEAAAEHLGTVTAEGLIEAMDSLLPAADRACLTGEVAEDFAAAMRHAVSGTVDGWLDDDLAFVSPWGFDLASIRVPVSLWQGLDDLMVPFAHGQWLAEHVPGVRAHLEPGQGHLSIVVGSIDRMLDELAGLAG